MKAIKNPMLQVLSNKCIADSIFFLVLFLISLVLTRFLIIFWVKPRIVRLRLTQQGIKGPKPSFLLGNIPEMKQIISASLTTNVSEQQVKKIFQYTNISSLFPYFKLWTKQYAGTFTFSLGTVQILYVADTDTVKEISLCKSLDLGKPVYLQKDRGPLLGKGVITTSGPLWLHQRKTIVPQLYTEKVKGMITNMSESAKELVKSWEKLVENEGGKTDIKVDDHIRSYTANVISRTLFGSNFAAGIEIFPKFRALMAALQSPTVLSGIPLLRYLPTKKNKEVWRLEKEIYTMITSVAKCHQKKDDDDDDVVSDMLRVLIEGSQNGERGTLTPEEFIVDNCKDLYLAGFEVTAVVSIWGLMLLAAHPEWQDRVRQEVLDVCGGHAVPEDIDGSMLNMMKVTRMVLQEVLRLYPGVAFVSRQAVEDVQLESLYIPKSANMWMWTPALHRDPELWGADAEAFNPERFSNGVLGACKYPHAYMPFGVGTRVCPGQNLAMAEMKVLYAYILSKFKLTISSKYRHSPTLGLLLEPEHGVDLVIEKI